VAVEKGLFQDYERCLQDEPAATTARCPLHVDVPKLCAAVAEQSFDAAFAELRRRVPLAAIVCLLCDHPCEAACVRGGLDVPVQIHEIERAAVVYGRSPFKAKFKPTGKKGRVAVVGGGLSGLCAAFELVNKGFSVEVLEAAERIGGSLWELAAAGGGAGNASDVAAGNGSGGAAGTAAVGAGAGHGGSSGAAAGIAGAAATVAVAGASAGGAAATVAADHGIGLGSDDIEAELACLKELGCVLHLRQPVDKLGLEQLCSDFDAVLLASGSWSERLVADPNTFQVADHNLFLAGALAVARGSLIAAVSSAKRAAASVERFVKKTSLLAGREREGAFQTLQPVPSLEYVLSLPAVVAAGEVFTPVEAALAAARCWRCECDACVRACPHLQSFGRKPKTYAREVYTNENVFLGTRYANKMINSCTLCGLCKERCPISLGMADLVRQARRTMVATDKMPPSAHDFALRDLAFSNSEHCFLARGTPLGENCVCPGGVVCPGDTDGDTVCQVEAQADVRGDHRHCGLDRQPFPPAMRSSAVVTDRVFFPGCQLAASSPELVEAAYRQLLAAPGGAATGLVLGCCGAPADWAGRDDLMAETADQLRQVWYQLGQPLFVMACASCLDVFSRYLPQIEVTSLWELLAADLLADAGTADGLPDISNPPDTAAAPSSDAAASAAALTDTAPGSSPQRPCLSIHDACTSRSRPAMQDSVRFLAASCGCQVNEQRWARDAAKCCGYGGAVWYANREQADQFARDGAQAGSDDLLVYCAMCKDLFVGQGRRCFHLLELLYASEPEAYACRPMPTLSERHCNRMDLKRRMLMEFWQEEPMDAPPSGLGGLRGLIQIDPEVQAAMEQRLILLEDIADVIQGVEDGSISCFLNPADGSLLASKRRKFVTYWVRYQKTADGFKVLSAYSHRMKIL